MIFVQMLERVALSDLVSVLCARKFSFAPRRVDPKLPPFHFFFIIIILLFIHYYFFQALRLVAAIFMFFLICPPPRDLSIARLLFQKSVVYSIPSTLQKNACSRFVLPSSYLPSKQLLYPLLRRQEFPQSCSLYTSQVPCQFRVPENVPTTTRATPEQGGRTLGPQARVTHALG